MKIRMKKIALLCTTGVLLTNTVPCYTASQTMISVPSSASNYAQIPDTETPKKDVGFESKVPKTLIGGFRFSSRTITGTYGDDISNSTANKRIGINFKYTSDEDTAKIVSFSAEPYDSQSAKGNTSISTCGGIELYYSTQYAGYLGWPQNDAHYGLVGISRGITKGGIAVMVKGIINMGADTVNGK